LDLIIVAPVAGLSAVVFSFYRAYRVLEKPNGSNSMVELSNTIKIGATAYLNRQFRMVAIFGAVLTALLALTLGVFAALTFIVGAFFSALSSYIGVVIAIRTNVKTAEAAKHGFKEALTTASHSGTVVGLSLTGLGLLAVSLLYLLVGDPLLLVGLGFGASLIGLFARVGGEYTLKQQIWALTWLER